MTRHNGGAEPQRSTKEDKRYVDDHSCHISRAYDRSLWPDLVLRAKTGLLDLVGLFGGVGSFCHLVRVDVAQLDAQESL